jgi:hypothetical protein
MDAKHIHPRQNKLLPAVPADRKPVSEQRSREGMLADEVFNARPSLAVTYAEATLMCAVLEDAVDCFQKQFSCATRRDKHLGQEAEQWLFSDDPNWPFSFLSICNMLELCPQYIRQGLKPGTTAFRNRRTSIGLSGEGRRAEVVKN